MLDDKIIASSQKRTRDEANNKKTTITETTQNLKEGDQVMLKDNPKKHNIRDTFVVTENLPNRLKIQKVVNGKAKLRNKAYFVPQHRLFKLEAKASQRNIQHVKKPFVDFDPVKRVDTSDSDDDSEHEELSNQEVNIAQNDTSEIENDHEIMNDLNINMELVNIDNNNLEQSYEADNMNRIEHMEESDESLRLAVPSPEGSTDPSPAVLNQHDNMDVDNVENERLENMEIDPEANQIEQNTGAKPKRKKDIHFTAKSRRKIEIWFTPQKHRQVNTRSAVENLRRKIAAVRIQKWYKKIKRQQIYERELITPEMYRDICNENSYIPENTPEARIISNTEDENLNTPENDVDDVFTENIDQESSCEWDTHETCIELSDPFNEAVLASPLNLQFSYSEPDLNRVYDFTHVLPVSSSPKALEPKKINKRKFNTLRKSIARFIGKKRGGTPSNRH